jgi:hypothetical protein
MLAGDADDDADADRGVEAADAAAAAARVCNVAARVSRSAMLELCHDARYVTLEYFESDRCPNPQ